MLSQAEYQFALQNDFFSFMLRCFYHLNPQTKFLSASHIEVIASKLEKCRLGIIRRLIINLPPRSLKSLCASVALSLGILGIIQARNSFVSATGRILPTSSRAIAGTS